MDELYNKVGELLMKQTSVSMYRGLIKYISLLGPVSYKIEHTGYREVKLESNPRISQLAIL